MSQKKNWGKYFSVPINVGETHDDWFARIARESKGEISIGSLRNGWQRYNMELYKNSEQNIQVNKPDYQHFSSDKWTLPDGKTEVKPQYIIDGSQMLVMNDIHLGFHDKLSIEAAIAHGQKKNPDVVLLNGDIIDCVSISRFNKSWDNRSFKDELDLGRGFLKWLRDKFPKAQIIFKLGNHEARLQAYIQRNADALDGVDDFLFDKLFRFENFGITKIEDTQIMKFGRLNIIHGHEFFGNAAINIARTLLLKSFDNIISAHRHQHQNYLFKKINGELVGSWSVACLCKFSAAYCPLNQWSNGFAEVEKTTDGFFHVDNHMMQDGRIL